MGLAGSSWKLIDVKLLLLCFFVNESVNEIVTVIVVFSAYFMNLSREEVPLWGRGVGTEKGSEWEMGWNGRRNRKGVNVLEWDIFLEWEQLSEPLFSQCANTMCYSTN